MVVCWTVWCRWRVYRLASGGGYVNKYNEKNEEESEEYVDK